MAVLAEAARKTITRAIIGPYPDWTPEVAMRYVPVARIINERHPTGLVTEIGSGGLGITPYLRRPVVGVDQDFEPRHPQLQPVAASVMALPFADASRDCVVCLDMLEHIPPDLRARALSELVRVTTKTLIVGAPAGIKAEQQDSELDRLYTKAHGASYPFLTEHVDLGLPAKGQIREWVDEAVTASARTARSYEMPNSNLAVRAALMKLWLRPSLASDRVLWSLNRFQRILTRAHWGDCYREIVVVDFAR